MSEPWPRAVLILLLAHLTAATPKSYDKVTSIFTLKGPVTLPPQAVSANPSTTTTSVPRDSAAVFCETRQRIFDDVLKSEVYQKAANLDLLIGAFLPSIPSQVIGGNHARGKLTHSLWPAIQLALTHIREHPCLLKGVNLVVNASDTADDQGQCSASMGTRRFFDMMNETPRRVALFGDACKEVNMPIAMAAKYWHILQLSYAETHPKFSGSDSLKTYETFYRIVPGADMIHRARLKVLAHYNWTKIGTVKQNDAPEFALTHESFIQQMEADRDDSDAVVHTEEVNADKSNMSVAIRALKEKDARIIVADTEAVFAASLLCQAYLNNMTGDDHVWILPGYLSDMWWLKLDATKFDEDCDAETRTRAFQGHFKIEFARTRPDESTLTIASKNTGEYLNLYQYQGCTSVLCDSDNAYHGYAYDGIWALAVALDTVNLQWIQDYGTPLNISDPPNSPSWELLINRLVEAMNKIEFEGVTGLVTFNRNVRKGIVKVSQFTNARYVTVGYYNGDTDEFSLTDNWIRTNDFTAPRDETVRVYRTEYISSKMYMVMAVAAVLGTVMSIMFLAINVYFRNHKFIRMSSPNLNNLIIAGSVLVYAKTWILCLGFTLSFGAMFSKTWRVHSIFTNIKLNKKIFGLLGCANCGLPQAIKDYQLFIIVAVLLMIDTVMLTTWMIVSPMSMNVTLLTSQSFMEADRLIIPQIEECSSDHSIVFQVALYVYKGLLMVLGCFLAWETRHVNVPALNDSKYIGISVYMVVLMSGLGVSLSIILRQQVSSSYAIISAFIIVSTTITLCLLFVPKIIELIRDPKGDETNYRKGMLTQKQQESFDSTSSGSSESDLRCHGLEEKRIELTLELSQKDTELDRLLAELNELGLTPPTTDEKAVSDSAFESSCTDDALHSSIIQPAILSAVRPVSTSHPLLHPSQSAAQPQPQPQPQIVPGVHHSHVVVSDHATSASSNASSIRSRNSRYRSSLNRMKMSANGSVVPANSDAVAVEEDALIDLWPDDTQSSSPKSSTQLRTHDCPIENGDLAHDQTINDPTEDESSRQLKTLRQHSSLLTHQDVTLPSPHQTEVIETQEFHFLTVEDNEHNLTDVVLVSDNMAWV